MAVLLRDVNPFPKEAYDGMAQNPELLAAIRRAPGFIAHLAVPADGGLTIMELWDSRAAAERFIREAVLPMMQQAGIQEAPQVEFQELHNLVLPG